MPPPAGYFILLNYVFKFENNFSCSVDRLGSLCWGRSGDDFGFPGMRILDGCELLHGSWINPRYSARAVNVHNCEPPVLCVL